MTGAQLLGALEHGVSAVEEGAGRFPSLSGMTMTWSRGAQPSERVKSVSVNGKPLDPTATYTVATNDFIAAGGDGYAVLTETKPLIDGDAAKKGERSEEHTSELQSLMRNSYAVFCLKKKK